MLGAVKRAVDAGAPAGRFILTGSVTAPVDQRMWLATGRIVDVPMWPITEAERVGATGGGGWIDAVFHG